MDYRKVVKRVVGLLNHSQGEYAVVGALATGYYGLARSTRDMDLLVRRDVEGFKKLVKAARKSGFMLVGSMSTVGEKKFTLEAKEGYRVVFWTAAEGHETVALSRRRKKRFFGTGVWLAAPEDLVVLKIRMGRPKDLTDVVGVLARQKGKLDLEYMRKWGGDLGLAGVFNDLVEKVW